MKKVNNATATKLCANLLNNLWTKLKYFSALHNSTTQLYSTLFKCENKRKIGWEN